MKVVHPIKSQAQRKEFEASLRAKSPTVADLWTFGVNSALRVGDIVGLRFSDWDFNMGVIHIVEDKTQKEKKIPITQALRMVYGERKAVQGEGFDFMFVGERSLRAKLDKSISRQYAHDILSKVGKEMGLQIGTHSMRKTRGFLMYKDGVPIDLISRMLNHSNTVVTREYIGVTQEAVDETYREYQFT